MSLRERWLALGFRLKLCVLTAGGALAVAALPPFFVLPAMIPGLVLLFWTLQAGDRLWRVFCYGWAWGFGYFVAGLYWLGYAIAVDLTAFWWAMPFALFGLQSCLAVFYGLAVLVTEAVRRRFHLADWPLALCLTAAWLGADGLRSVLLTGFPWNLLGTVWVVSGPTMQAASWGGVHFLTLTALLWALSPGLIKRNRRLVPLSVFLLIPLGLYGFGAMRINHHHERAAQNAAGVHLRLVQANIAQSLKWDLAVREQNLRRHIDLSLLPNASAQPASVVIWPETAVYFPLNRYEEARKTLAAQITPKDGLFITGGNRELKTGTSYRAWNHLYALDRAGQRVGGYDKHHLVPFGEFTPLQGLLSSLKITPGTVGFSHGPGPQTLDLPGVPKVAPIICYEGIFSGHVIDRTNRPEWLLSITNDGWFGLSTGPYQHLAATKLRSVEEGLPLVRVSNPGVSVITDALGLERGRTALGEETVLDGPLPVALGQITVFSRMGSALFWVLFAALLGSVFAINLIFPAKKRRFPLDG